MHCAVQLMVMWYCPRQHFSGESESMTELPGVIEFYPSTCQLRHSGTKDGPKMHSDKVSNPPPHLNGTVEQCLSDNPFHGLIMYNFHTFLHE